MSTASKRTSARKTYRTEWVDRWSPPKPLVGLQAIEKVLNRHTFLVCPESRLVVAVLARAIHDSLSLTNRRMRREARRFLLGLGLRPADSPPFPNHRSRLRLEQQMSSVLFQQRLAVVCGFDPTSMRQVIPRR